MNPNPGLIHDNAFDYYCSLVVDVFIFLIKSFYFLAETIYLTILPNKLRNLKVSGRAEQRQLRVEENN